MNPLAGSGIGAAQIGSSYLNYEQDQHAWGFRAYARFNASLSAETRSRLALKEQHAEPYVVIFGKTQVGKTTLLLDLMGVHAQHAQRVAGVLRGGQARGRSATATTMEYQQSPDQRWGLRRSQADTVWFELDLDMEYALRALRQDMEKGGLSATAPCVVFLPAEFFANSDRSPVRILDLPGDKPSNAKEQDHVTAMAAQYVPLANLILLVGRGDDLSFLKKGALTLPIIEDWQSAPRRFKIITTYSFTPQSIRELVRNSPTPPTLDFFRGHLIAEITRSIPLNAFASNAEIFFPLEFGQSWIDAENQDLALFERVNPMIAALKQQLLVEIYASTSKLSRLRAAIDAHIVVTNLRATRLDDMAEAAAALKLERDAVLAQRDLACAALRQTERRCAQGEAQMQQVTFKTIDAEVERIRIPTFVRLDVPPERVPDFTRAVELEKTVLRRHVTEARPTGNGSVLASFWSGVRAAVDERHMNAVVDDAFRDFFVHLGSYWTDWYGRTDAGSNYCRDLAAFDACASSARYVATELLQRWWRVAALEKSKADSKIVEALRVTRSMWQHVVDEQERSLAALNAQLAQHETRYTELVARMDGELDASKRFVELLDSEYLLELQSRRSVICSEPSPTRALLGLFAAVDLQQVRQQILLQVD
ncbi:MAG: hypothetical protein V4723_07360 [Pseudomonadota bacterium]